MVATGNHQQAGIDFHETFSPVVCPATIHLILSIAVTHNWPIRQLDVKNAFFHGFLTARVHMRKPPSSVDPPYPHHVCRLKKALYGLKQAPRAWFHRFSSFLLTHGFICSQSDPSMFIFRSSRYILVLLLYVDDIILTGSSSSLLFSFVEVLPRQFVMKDLSDFHYFLGVQVSRSYTGLFLSQHKYTTDLLRKFHLNLQTCPCTNP